MSTLYRDDQDDDGNSRWKPASMAVLALCLVVCFAAAAIGSALTTPEIGGWYAGLQKPVFNPPDSVFAPVWTVLFALMGISLWRVWLASTGTQRRDAVLAFAVQLVLNVGWSAAFFAAHSPAAGLLVISVLFIAILVTISRFGRIDRLAGWLLVPYVVWVAFAMVLNLAIWILNG